MQRLTIPNDVLLPEVVRLLRDDQNVTLRTKGNSMLPFIHGGRDSVVLQHPHNLHRGDIVLACLADGRFVLHRIVGFDEDSSRHPQSVVVLMGDGNLCETERCTRADITGKAVKIIRNNKYIDCSAPSEQRKVRVWIALLPLRRYLLAIYRQVYLARIAPTKLQPPKQRHQ